MLKGIRGRLIFYYLIVIAVIVFSMGAFFIWFLNFLYMQTLQENLLSQARLTSALIEEMLERNASPFEIDVFTKSLGNELGIRITLIQSDGTVLADSSENPHVMDNHLDRPEIYDAINAGQGFAARYSTTVSEEMYYLAIPLNRMTEEITNQQDPQAIVRLALPLSSINQAVYNLKLSIFGILLLSTLLALVAALILSQRLTGPIRQIRGAAQAISEGNYMPELIVGGPNELSELAEKISEMGLNLKLRMDQVLGEKNKLEKVISSMSSGIILTDSNLDIELINPAAEKLFDISRDQAVYEPLKKVLRNYTLYENLKAVQKEKKAALIELNAYYPRSAVLETYLLPVFGASRELIGILLLFHEVTHIRSMEKMRSDFVANVSHELRTPLTAIRGYTETILHEELNREQQQQFLEIINRETLRLSDLLNDLLDLAQIENEKSFVKKESVDLKKMITEAVARVEQLQKQNKVIIKVTLITEDLVVKGNYEWLCQAVVNILENSIRHGRQGGTINISLTGDNLQAAIEINDDGPGIPEVDLPYIFERFYRVDKARSRKSGGTGLGLSIVKHIMEAHGAQYRIESQEDEGTSFSFNLPL
jgi:two-component system, OmpR family, phosphate regulon sensor histidine kinase PhoR